MLQHFDVRVRRVGVRIGRKRVAAIVTVGAPGSVDHQSQIIGSVRSTRRPLVGIRRKRPQVSHGAAANPVTRVRPRGAPH